MPSSEFGSQRPGSRRRTTALLAADNLFSKGDTGIENLTVEAPNGDVSAAAVLSIRGVSRRFRRRDGSVVTALDNVSLKVSDHEFVVLLGPSGCGKSTLLRCVAGLEKPQDGEIEIAGRLCSAPRRRVFTPPERRGVSMVFQSYALWPHMTVFDNVAYPLRHGLRRTARKRARELVMGALERTRITEVAQQYPGFISGGQQQRVALARSIVSGTRLMLFDEPLSNVDAQVRVALRLELAQLHEELGFTALYVTHDQDEAMSLGTRIAVMGTGSIMQVGSPHEIYSEPASRRVASFVGRMNEVPGTVLRVSAGSAVVTTEAGALEGKISEVALGTGDKILFAWRPEDTRVSYDKREPGAFAGRVSHVSYLGTHLECAVETADTTIVARLPIDQRFVTGDQVWIAVADGAGHVFPHRVPTQE